MTCQRCHGYMISDGFEASRIDSGESRFSGWRCVNCGEVVDPVIESHRRQNRRTVGGESNPHVREAADLAA